MPVKADSVEEVVVTTSKTLEDTGDAVVTTTSEGKSDDNEDASGESASAAGESSETLSVEGLGKAVKRAMDDFSAAISSKPTKKPRYSFGNDDGQSMDDFYKEMMTSPVEMSLSIHSYNGVIPPDKLRLEERHTPLDVRAFISRVQTYDLLFWPNKPERLNAFQCSRYGWKIAGMNTLVCVSCHRVEIIPKSVPSCMSLTDWIVQIEDRIKTAGHMTGCIWTRSPSPENILMLPCGNDMQSYLIHTAATFKRMKTVPLLKTHYRVVMTNVDLTGLRSKTNMNLNQEIDGATHAVVEHTALFLMMNGWSMEGSCEDALKCQRCLREIPLWLSKSTPTQVVIDEILTPTNSPRTQAQSNIKELDPVMNHCVWCPWRVQLQEVDKKEMHKASLSFGEEHNFYSNAGSTSDIRKQPKIEDYMRLACKVESDFKSGQLLQGDIHEISKNDSAVRTLMNVKDLLNSVTGNKQDQLHSSGPKTTIKLGDKNADLSNEIMAITQTPHCIRNLFNEDVQ